MKTIYKKNISFDWLALGFARLFFSRCKVVKMSDSKKVILAVSAFAYSAHYFSNGVSLCGAHSYDPFFAHSSPSCDKKLCKKMSQSS